MTTEQLMWMRKTQSAMVLDTAIAQTTRTFSINLYAWLRARGIDQDSVKVSNVKIEAETVSFDVTCKEDRCLVAVRQLRLEFPELPMNERPSRDQLGKRLASAFPGLSVDQIKDCSVVGADGWAVLDIALPNIVLAPGSAAQFALTVDMLRGRSQALDPVAEAKLDGEREISRLKSLGASDEDLAALQQVHLQRAQLIEDALRPKVAEVVDMTAPLAYVLKGLEAPSHVAVARILEDLLTANPPDTLNLAAILGIDYDDPRSLAIALRIPLAEGTMLGVAIEAALVGKGYQPMGNLQRWVRNPNGPSPTPIDTWWRRETMPKGVLRIEERTRDGGPVYYVAADTSDAQLKIVTDLVSNRIPPATVEREAHMWGVKQNDRFVAQGFQTEAQARASAAAGTKGTEVAPYVPTAAERKS